METKTCNSCRNRDATKTFSISWLYRPPDRPWAAGCWKRVELILCENCFETAETIDDFQTVGNDQATIESQANLKIYEVRRSRAEIEYDDYLSWHSGQYP